MGLDLSLVYGIYMESHTPEGGSPFFAFSHGQATDRLRMSYGQGLDKTASFLSFSAWTILGQATDSFRKGYGQATDKSFEKKVVSHFG
jgi:hypothetical protein